MKSPRYYVQNLELDIEPNLTDIDFGKSNLTFEVDDSPEYDSDLGGLKFESGIELELECFPNPMHESNKDLEEEIGNIEVDIIVIIEGAKQEFEQHVSTWEEEGYRETDWDFRYHIESGIITEVFSPISNVVKNSFRGVLPGLAFTDPPSTDDDELPVERSEFLRQYLEENIRDEVVEYLSETVEMEFDIDEIEIHAESLKSLELHIPEELESEYDDQEIHNIVSSVFSRIVEEEAGEDIGSVSVEATEIDADAEE